jgi:hypothetical protein
VDEAKDPNKSFQPFQISGDLSLFLSNDHQLCYLYLHYECSLRPVFDAEVLYPDISPKHLNALADLEIIYRNLYRMKDANRCRLTIDSILKSTSDADVQIKRTCLLEQGYAILIERTLVNVLFK